MYTVLSELISSLGKLIFSISQVKNLEMMATTHFVHTMLNYLWNIPCPVVDLYNMLVPHHQRFIDLWEKVNIRYAVVTDRKSCFVFLVFFYEQMLVILDRRDKQAKHMVSQILLKDSCLTLFKCNSLTFKVEQWCLLLLLKCITNTWKSYFTLLLIYWHP